MENQAKSTGPKSTGQNPSGAKPGAEGEAKSENEDEQENMFEIKIEQEFNLFKEEDILKILEETCERDRSKIWRKGKTLKYCYKNDDEGIKQFFRMLSILEVWEYKNIEKSCNFSYRCYFPCDGTKKSTTADTTEQPSREGKGQTSKVFGRERKGRSSGQTDRKKLPEDVFVDGKPIGRTTDGGRFVTISLKDKQDALRNLKGP